MASIDKSTRWLRYYRSSLIDANRMAQKLPENAVSLRSLRELNKHHAGQLLPAVKRSDGKEERARQVEVQISPLYFVESATHGRKPNQPPLHPFWIPAILTDEAELLPPEKQDITPQFIREVLSPMAEYHSRPTIGNIEAFDEALDSFPFEGQEFGDFFTWAERIFSHVVGSPLRETEIAGYRRHDSYTIITDTVSGANAPLLETYDIYLKRNLSLPGLTESFLNAEHETEQRTLPEERDIFLNKQHIAQMSNDFPLSDSQRIALAAYVRTAPAEALAVNGPPGTGKTTLLRSVVANEIVRSAQQGERPIRILASSTNNQAITNILDNLSRITEAGLLSQRWISLPASLGTYMAAETKVEKVRDRNPALPLIRKSQGKLESDYVDSISEFDMHAELSSFTVKLSEYFGTSVEALRTAEEAAAFLKEQIDERLTLLRESIAAAQQLGEQLEAEDGPFSALERKIEEASAEVEYARRKKEAAERLHAEYIRYLDKEGFHRRIFHFLPAVKQSRFRDLRLRLYPHAPADFFHGLTSPAEITEALQELLSSCHKQLEEKHASLRQITAYADVLRKLAAKWDTYIRTAAPEPEKLQRSFQQVVWYRAISMVLDLTVRHEAFLLSLRYWEARWLLSCSERSYAFSNGVKGRTSMLNEIAHLTPLFVSTCQSAPRFLTCPHHEKDGSWSTVPIGKVFDLVVMDEAGQVSPEIGLSPFFFGKKALVVGDVHQIKPIWGITSTRVDAGNLYECGLIAEDEQFFRLRQTGILASNGSIMQIAQRLSPYTYPLQATDRGVLLREHRRCADEVIEYNNRYIYENNLIPFSGSLSHQRKSRKAKGLPVNTLPALGYMSIRGRTEKSSGGSRYNSIEADAIAAFIADYAEEISASYDGTRVSELIGIVTPFRAQKRALQDALKTHGLDAENYVVGTVHALQGAERPIVLFSPTYDSSAVSTPLFFDADWNMLNVAVSRAKHHFIVIGEMGLFNPRRSDRPSGALARLLFSATENEISSAPFFRRTTLYDTPGQDEEHFVDRLDSLNKHVRALKRAFAIAHSRIIIISPFISIRAIEADGLVALIRKVKEAGIEVVVYTDDHLDKRDGSLKPWAQQGRQALEEANAKLRYKTGIHNKALVIDDQILIEGSFNWLSAQRDPSDRYRRYEVSVAMKTDNTPRDIDDLLTAVEAVPDAGE
jgi:hypothetical protein